MHKTLAAAHDALSTEDGNAVQAAEIPDDEPAGAIAAKPVTLHDLYPEFSKLDGWLHLPEAETLFAYAALVSHGCIVEIGSYRGRSTVALCAGSRAGAGVPVFAVEPHEVFIGTRGGNFGPNDRAKFFKTMLETKLTGMVRLLNTTSEILAGRWQQPVSLLFIDGDRRYESVREDFSSWHPYLLIGAPIIFKDFHEEGPARVIEELVQAGVLTPMRQAGSLQVLTLARSAKHLARATTVRNGDTLAIDAEIAIKAVVEQPGLDAQTIAYNVYYGDEGRYLYQPIPKCACTSIKTMLLELEGLPIDANEWRRHDKSANRFPGVNHLTEEEQRSIYQGATDTFKFVIVRDPFTRMASVYLDKIAMIGRKRAMHWIDLVRQAAVTQEVELADEISFNDFVKVASAQPLEAMDAHWRPQYFEGRFGQIKFDCIGHMEMLSSDMTYILERLEAPAHLIRSVAKPQNVTGAAMAIWADVSSETRATFLKTYEIDFDSLRYPYRTAMDW